MFVVLRTIYCWLTRSQKRQLACLLAGGVVLAFVEMASVGSLALMATVISNPATIMKSERLAAFPSLLRLFDGMSSSSLILFAGMAALILLMLKNAFGAAIVYANATVCAKIDAYFGELLIQNILNKPYVWLLRQNSADLFTVTSWRRHVGGGVLFMSVQILCDAMVISILLAGILITSPLISLVLLLGTGGAGAVVFRLFRASSTQVGTHLKELEGMVNRHLTTTLRGAKDVKILGLNEVFQSRFAADSIRYARCEGKYRLLLRLPSMVFEVLGFAVLLLGIAAFLLLRTDASVGAILGFLTLLTVTAWRILNAINRVLSSLSAIRLDIPPARNVLELLKQDAVAPVAVSGVLRMTREIRLDKVSFLYPGAAVPSLRDVSLVISKGLCLGVVGGSGAGKSTLVDILIGLLSPDAGTMTVDGTVLDATNVPTWMHNIGYVGQTPYLLDTTLKENIAFGVACKDIDLDRVRECCRLAHIDEFLHELPQDLDSPLGEGGVNLSGGQRQRVAIARALYRRPEILLLDEATSALDMQNENAVRRTILALTGQITMVIIAHRLSAVESCNVLLWLEQGRVKDFGPPAELLARYRKCMGGVPT